MVAKTETGRLVQLAGVFLFLAAVAALGLHTVAAPNQRAGVAALTAVMTVCAVLVGAVTLGRLATTPPATAPPLAEPVPEMTLPGSERPTLNAMAVRVAIFTAGALKRRGVDLSPVADRGVEDGCVVTEAQFGWPSVQDAEPLLRAAGEALAANLVARKVRGVWRPPTSGLPARQDYSVAANAAQTMTLLALPCAANGAAVLRQRDATHVRLTLYVRHDWSAL